LDKFRAQNTALLFDYHLHEIFNFKFLIFNQFLLIEFLMMTVKTTAGKLKH